MSQPEKKPKSNLFAIIGPGLLVAATGVGAGDLATGALTGSRLGVAVLWVVLAGAFMKFVLNEGLARWQLATGSTVLEGTAKHFGRVALIAFLAYLCVWSYFVGAALMSACGVTMHALLPISDANTDKITYGVLHSFLAVVLVRLGGYRLFGKVMGICIAAMFLIVLVNTIAVKPDWGDVAIGAVWPTIPQLDGDGLEWTFALMGGIGGTVTVLCYGYWIREEKREGLNELRNCRIDLLTGYVMTAVFGLGMVILGSKLAVDTSAKPAQLVVNLANQLRDSLGGFGSVASFAFLIGVWGAVFTSVLGVWQSVPYLFADCLRLIKNKPAQIETVANASDIGSLTKTRTYNWSMLLLATIPIFGLFTKFDRIQLAYALVGAAFMPLLAIALLVLNGSTKRIGQAARNSKLTTLVLGLIVAMFVAAAYYEAKEELRNRQRAQNLSVVRTRPGCCRLSLLDGAISEGRDRMKLDRAWASLRSSRERRSNLS